MGKINYHLIALMDSLSSPETPSAIRRCKPEECPHYGINRDKPSQGYVCKRHSNDLRPVIANQECIDQLPKR